MKSDDIKRDMEEGTPGPWSWDSTTFTAVWGAGDKLVRYTANYNGSDADARRIARLPDLEKAYLEQAERITELEAQADELAEALEAAEHALHPAIGLRQRFGAMKLARAVLKKYRET